MKIPDDLKAEYDFAGQIWSEHTDPNDTDARHYRRRAQLIERIAKLEENYAVKRNALLNVLKHLRVTCPDLCEASSVWRIAEDALMCDSDGSKSIDKSA